MRSQLVNHRLLEHDPDSYARFLILARQRLDHLSSFYPEFSQWFNQKVEPGLRTGERTLLMRHAGRELAGIAVLKHDLEERKLCCLRVLPDFSGSGIGLRLFEDSFEILQTCHPLLSVCEEQLPHFQRVFDHFGFRHGRCYEGFYRTGVAEHSFNGLLSPNWNEEPVSMATR